MTGRSLPVCGALWLLVSAGCAHQLPLPAGAPGQGDGAASEAQQRLETRIAGGARGDLAAEDSRTSADGEDFDDLFERMRAGFGLSAVEDLSIRRQLEWYVSHPDYLDRTFDRSRRYLHHIVAELEQRNMPCELALLPVVESAFDPFAHSPSRASGLWQFIPSTGRRYGLDQDWWRDERRDVLAATSAALDHLQKLHDEFDGDWLLALAAYNAGAGRVSREIERNRARGLPTDFFHLHLRPETRAYVPKLLAIAEVVAEPSRFGVELPEIPNEPYFVQVDVGGQVDLGLVANLAAIPLDELRALNPEFKRFATSPDGPHELLVPADAKDRCDELLARLPAAKRMRFEHYRVRRGDTLIAIARRHRISLVALRAVNRLRGSLIHPGQDLLVPLPWQPTPIHADTPSVKLSG